MTTEKGVKHDQEKPRLDLVLGAFSHALLEVGKVGTFGAREYTDNGWIEVPNGIERYSNAMWRHYFDEKCLGPRDGKSELLHAAHLAWNALARLELLILEEALIRMNETPVPPAPNILPANKNSRRLPTTEDLEDFSDIEHTPAFIPCDKDLIPLNREKPPYVPDLSDFAKKNLRTPFPNPLPDAK